MRPQDKSAFLATLNGLAAMKPGAKLTPESLDLWWTSMQGWSLEDFKAAANHLVNAVEFFPNPYHFEQLRKAGEQTAGEAFALARMIVRNIHPRELRYHSSGDVKLDKAIRACGGYEALAMCETDNIGFFERRFAGHYETISDAEDIREELPALTFGGESVFRSLGETKRINAK